jgi:hypothetical protein
MLFLLHYPGLYFFCNGSAFFEQVLLGSLTKTMKTSTTFTLTRTLSLNIMVTGYVFITLKKIAETYMLAD